MSVLKMKNPICLRFLPFREQISGVIFALTAWAYLFCATWTATTLKSTHKVWFNQASLLMWIIVFVAIANLILLNDYTVGNLILIVIAAALFYVTTLFGGSKHLFLSFCLVMSGKHVNWKLFIGITTFVYAAIIAAVIAARYLGYLVPVNMTKNGWVRSDMGFNHPNVYAGYIMAFCICWMMWRFRSLNILDYILFALAAVYCWIFPANYTAAAVLVLMIVLLPLFQHAGDWMSRNIFFRILFILVYPVMFGGSLFLAYFYWNGGRYFGIADKLLMGRVKIMHAFVTKYPVSLLGQKIKTIKKIGGMKTSAVLDNSYIRMFLENGVIAAVILILFMTLLVYAAMKHHRIGLLLALCLMAAYGLVENRVAKVAFDLPMLAMPLIFTAVPPKKETEPSRHPRVTKRYGKYSREDFE